MANLGSATVTVAGAPRGRLLFAGPAGPPEDLAADLAAGRLPGCSVAWYLEAADEPG
jgi:hypothetical protein